MLQSLKSPRFTMLNAPVRMKMYQILTSCDLYECSQRHDCMSRLTCFPASFLWFSRPLMITYMYCLQFLRPEYSDSDILNFCFGNELKMIQSPIAYTAGKSPHHWEFLRYSLSRNAIIFVNTSQTCALNTRKVSKRTAKALICLPVDRTFYPSLTLLDSVCNSSSGAVE